MKSDNDSRLRQDDKYNPAFLAELEKNSPGPKSSESPSGDYDTSLDKSLIERENTPFTNNYTGKHSGRRNVRHTIKNLPRILRSKKGIAGIGVGGGAGIVGIIAMLMTPALGIVHMKETFLGDLNDQLAAMDIRGGHVMRTKFKNISSGICSGPVKVRCKFKTMSPKQVAKFEKAGFKVTTEKLDNGRLRLQSLELPGERPITSPSELNRARGGSLQLRSHLNKAFNPKFAGFADRVALGRFQARGLSKKPRNRTGSTAERKASMVKASSGQPSGVDARGAVQSDEKGRYIYDPESRENVYESDEKRFKEVQDKVNKIDSELKAKPESGGSKVKGLFKGIGGGTLRGVSVVGYLDSACVVRNSARAVSATAKVLRATQLARFAMEINNVADSIKAGDADPKDVEMIGDMLSSFDTRKKVVNETSGADVNTLDNKDTATLEEVDNPFYGKNAYDSPGFQVSAYNIAPRLTSQSSQYSVGGALSGTFGGVLDTVNSALSGAGTSCKIIQNPFVRGTGIIVGIFGGLGTGGVLTAATISASVAISLSLPFLEAQLADMLTGQVIPDDIKSVEAGDAAHAGNGVIMSDLAQSRGMQPSNASQMERYAYLNSEVHAEIAQIEKYDAKHTPFDVMNQYSFLGITARSILPATLKTQGSLASVAAGISSIPGLAIRSIATPVSAKESFNPKRFSKCEDEGYKDLGIDADVFCIVRFSMSPDELNMDTEQVVEYMINNGYVDDDTGEAKGDYKKFIKNCTQREDGWGETSTENGSTGSECIDSSTKWKDISYFRVYTIDSQINDALDDDFNELSRSGGLSDEGQSESQYPGSVSASGEWGSPVPSGAYNSGAAYGALNINGIPHAGIDAAGFSGNFMSVCNGVVSGVDNKGERNTFRVANGWNYTNHLTINCGGGIWARYHHYYFRDVVPGIKVGTPVKVGQPLAKVSDQGYSTGPHLHFEIRTKPSGSNKSDTMNPVTFLQSKGVRMFH